MLAAIAGLLSGKHANEAMMNQIEASDQWNYYQAKSIKASVLDAKMSLAGVHDESDQSKRDRYEQEQEKIKSEAERKEAAAKSNFHKHEVFARGVTMFQIAIAIAAISALTKRRKFWIVSLIFGGVGCDLSRARRDRKVGAVDSLARSLTEGLPSMSPACLRLHSREPPGTIPANRPTKSFSRTSAGNYRKYFRRIREFD